MSKQAPRGEWTIELLPEPLASSASGPVTGPPVTINASALLSGGSTAAAGPLLGQELPAESPYQNPVDERLKELYIYLTDNERLWKLFKIWASGDGSFHRVNYAFNHDTT